MPAGNVKRRLSVCLSVCLYKLQNYQSETTDAESGFVCSLIYCNLLERYRTLHDGKMHRLLLYTYHQSVNK